MTSQPRHPRPPRRFPGAHGSVPARHRGPRRWILGHCGACTLPLAVAGVQDGSVHVWRAIKVDNERLRDIQAKNPGWPHHGTWIASPTNLTEWALATRCPRCQTRHTITHAQALALASAAISAGARRFTIGETP